MRIIKKIENKDKTKYAEIRKYDNGTYGTVCIIGKFQISRGFPPKQYKMQKTAEKYANKFLEFQS